MGLNMLKDCEVSFQVYFESIIRRTKWLLSIFGLMFSSILKINPIKSISIIPIYYLGLYPLFFIAIDNNHILMYTTKLGNKSMDTLELLLIRFY